MELQFLLDDGAEELAQSPSPHGRKRKASIVLSSSSCRTRLHQPRTNADADPSSEASSTVSLALAPQAPRALRDSSVWRNTPAGKAHAESYRKVEKLVNNSKAGDDEGPATGGTRANDGAASTSNSRARAMTATAPDLLTVPEITINSERDYLVGLGRPLWPLTRSAGDVKDDAEFDETFEEDSETDKTLEEGSYLNETFDEDEVNETYDEEVEFSEAVEEASQSDEDDFGLNGDGTATNEEGPEFEDTFATSEEDSESDAEGSDDITSLHAKIETLWTRLRAAKAEARTFEMTNADLTTRTLRAERRAEEAEERAAALQQHCEELATEVRILNGEVAASAADVGAERSAKAARVRFAKNLHVRMIHSRAECDKPEVPQQALPFVSYMPPEIPTKSP